MKINKYIAGNVLLDWQKHDIDKIERARFIKDYMKDHNISLRQLSVQTNIPKTTLHDWIAYDRLTKSQFKHLKNQGVTKTQIHKYLQYNLDKKYINVEVKPIDIELKEVLSKLRKYNNGGIEGTTQSKELLREISNLVHSIMGKLR